MSRDIPQEYEDEANKETLAAFWLVELDTEPPVFVSSLPYNWDYNGQTYEGIGGLGTISGIREEGEIAAGRISLTLSGVDPTKLFIALNTPYQGREGRVFLAMINQNTGKLIEDATLLAAGLIDTMPISIAKESSITVNLTTILAKWEKANERRYTLEDQKRFFPKDTGLRFVPQMAQKAIVWPSADFKE